MLEQKTRIAAAVAALAFAAASFAADLDYTQMSPQDLAEHLIFKAGGFNLDEKVQEGGTAGQRLVQDDLQKLCTQTGNRPSAEQATAIMKAAKDSIKYPEGDIKLGDWKKGRELAWSGFGYRLTPAYDDHTNREAGANCYNCHQIATDRQGGTLGPVLTGYGKIRGNSPEVIRLTYEIVYNPHAYFPCTRMPRQGAKGLLSQEAILDILAYLFDPASPVNK